MHRMIPAAFAALAVLAVTLPAAALDVNQANEAELDGIRGIGPALSRRILQVRDQGAFRNWDDLIRRVPGMGRANAERLSDAGLSVGGTPYERRRPRPEPAAAAPPAPSDR